MPIFWQTRQLFGLSRTLSRDVFSNNSAIVQFFFAICFHVRGCLNTSYLFIKKHVVDITLNVYLQTAAFSYKSLLLLYQKLKYKEILLLEIKEQIKQKQHEKELKNASQVGIVYVAGNCTIFCVLFLFCFYFGLFQLFFIMFAYALHC